MRILISGASGLVGTALTIHLRARGHQVGHFLRPGRTGGEGDVRWDPESGTVDLAAMEGADAVAHLSGASIAEGRWTQKRKELLQTSRVGTTRVLVDSFAQMKRKPHVFVCASAIGYYGNRGDEILTEASPPGTDFLSQLAGDWEAQALRAGSSGIRTALLRFGVIFSSTGGALPRMLAPFKYGMGGKLGSGKQWMSWIALEDAMGAASAAIANEELSGPLNVVAPEAVRNVEFTSVAARVLHRPALLPAPAFALRLALGEMADGLLLSSQRVQPAKLLALGYPFRYDNLVSALGAILDGEEIRA